MTNKELLEQMGILESFVFTLLPSISDERYVKLTQALQQIKSLLEANNYQGENALEGKIQEPTDEERKRLLMVFTEMASAYSDKLEEERSDLYSELCPFDKKTIQKHLIANEMNQKELYGIRYKIYSLIINKLRGDRFIAHIQAHLKPGEKVICKICGKTVEEIENE